MVASVDSMDDGSSSNAVDMMAKPLLADGMYQNSCPAGNGMAKVSRNRRTVVDTVDFGTDMASVSTPVSVDSSRHSLDNSASLLSITSTPIQYIDNTTLVYVPITLESGNEVYCAPDVLSRCPMILRSIQTDMKRILKILPWSVHALVKRTKIWINATYSYGPRDDRHVLRHSTTHHEEGWLVECARDHPDKARGIEIYSCFEFERMRLHWNGCGLLLHEFCHLIHQFCLGLDNPKVKALYAHADESGRYECTLRRDWAGKEDDSDLAYAMVDEKEFFAEMSVTYLSNGYHDLDRAENTTVEACSPPLLEPKTFDRVTDKYGLWHQPYMLASEDKCTFWKSFSASSRGIPCVRIIDPNWQEAAIARGCRDISHCNKFYPFTRGQLKHYDPALHDAMRQLWSEITMYDDPEEELPCCLKLTRFLPTFR